MRVQEVLGCRVEGLGVSRPLGVYLKNSGGWGLRVRGFGLYGLSPVCVRGYGFQGSGDLGLEVQVLAAGGLRVQLQGFVRCRV